MPAATRSRHCPLASLPLARRRERTANTRHTALPAGPADRGLHSQATDRHRPAMYLRCTWHLPHVDPALPPGAGQCRDHADPSSSACVSVAVCRRGLWARSAARGQLAASGSPRPRPRNLHRRMHQRDQWSSAAGHGRLLNVNALLTGIIGIAATLLGSFSTYLFQSRRAERAQAFARDERLRQEQLNACSG